VEPQCIAGFGLALVLQGHDVSTSGFRLQTSGLRDLEASAAGGSSERSLSGLQSVACSL
jgi:hypothetical protein